MSLVHYSAISHRFAHIDARFVGCNIAMPEEGHSFFRVAIYPWWEHPLYLKARQEGTPWGFRGVPDDAYRTVTVYPRGLREAHLSPASEVIDWTFTREHQLLWGYEDYREITCNSRLSVNDWMHVVGEVCEALGNGCSFDDINRYPSFANIFRWGPSPPFLLGRLPRPVATGVCRAFDSKGIRYFAGKKPDPVNPPVLFLIDAGDYIIADDFEIDVPEFIHDPEWFHAG